MVDRAAVSAVKAVKSNVFFIMLGVAKAVETVCKNKQPDDGDGSKERR